MRVIAAAAFKGPSLYAPHRAILLRLKLGAMTAGAKVDPATLARLFELLPGLATHPADGSDRDLAGELRDGLDVSLGHVVARMALEYQRVERADVARSIVSPGPNPDEIDVAFEFQEADVGRRAGALAVAQLRVVLGLAGDPALASSGRGRSFKTLRPAASWSPKGRSWPGPWRPAAYRGGRRRIGW
ncbi:MAG: hypothetical protein EXQ94_10445 [Alphaproteobacteria bacterium]|nr:hypothetical protein [Alphaproteobacteria bacterium]